MTSGWGAKIPHASQLKKPKHKAGSNIVNKKFNKDFKKWSTHKKKPLTKQKSKDYPRWSIYELQQVVVVGGGTMSRT